MRGMRWLAVALVLVAVDASARTLVFPHVLESSGRADTDPNAVDTTIFLAYVGGLPGVPARADLTAQVDLYLFDDATSLPLLSLTGTPVCNPCTYQLGPGTDPAAPRKRTVTLHDEIVARGGFPVPTLAALALLVVTGDETNTVLTAAIVNARTGPLDLAITELTPQGVGASTTGGGAR